MSFQESIMGWKMFLGGGLPATDGGSAEVLGTVGPGFSAAQQRFVGIKAGQVSAQVPSVALQATEDPGTPATVIATIQKSIGDSAEGWRMGFASVAGKLGGGFADVQKEIEKSLAGWQMGISEAGGKVSESFGNVGDWFKSTKWQMLLPIIILAFIAVMVAIGYSGLGAPAARVAEREYVKRR